MKNWIYNLFIPHKQYSKVFCFQQQELLTLTKSWLKLLAYKLLNLEMVILPNIHFSIFHLCLLNIIKFPLNILTLYFQTNHFLLPFSEYFFNLVLVLFLHFFQYSLNKLSSFSSFLIWSTMKLRSLAFWRKWLSLV